MQLVAEAAQPGLILLSGDTQGELCFEIFGQLLLQPKGRLVIETGIPLYHAEDVAQFFMRKPLHPNQQSALVPLPAGPSLDAGVNLLPTAQVEVADTEIGAGRGKECLLQSWFQLAFDIVKNAGHGWLLVKRWAERRLG